MVGFENFTCFLPALLCGAVGPYYYLELCLCLFQRVMTFALGLAIAYIYNDPDFPGKKIIQSFLLIPYTIPSLITIMIWRGMLNTRSWGYQSNLESIDWHMRRPGRQNQCWAKAAILMVNLWLGYPYFMLICSGALQAIPTDIYEAAEVDGANAWQSFRKITLAAAVGGCWAVAGGFVYL